MLALRFDTDTSSTPPLIFSRRSKNSKFSLNLAFKGGDVFGSEATNLKYENRVQSANDSPILNLPFKFNVGRSPNSENCVYKLPSPLPLKTAKKSLDRQ